MNRFALLVFLLCAATSWAQEDSVPEFIMNDTTVTACDGRLFDSGYDDQYGISEDFTFTISSTVPISVMFEENFCVEVGFDALEIYDGPDTGSPLIGIYDGFDLPPNFTSTGSITFHFYSNENVQYCGFQLVWDVLAPPPANPAVDLLPPVCESNVVPISFSFPIGCNWLIPESVNFFSDEQVFDVVGINYNCAGDSSVLHELVLDQVIDVNCLYTLEMQLLIPDVCDSLWHYPYLQTLLYDSCPIRSETFADPEEVCAGGCSQVWVEVEGCYEHTYLWDTGAVGPGPHVVCPDQTTTFVVEITEVETGNTAVDSVLVTVIDAEILNAPAQYCQSAGVLDLEGFPDEGTWSGTGIENPEQGWFNPDSALVGMNQIIYEVSLGCIDTAYIEVVPIVTDSVVAACLGSTAFMLNAQPSGGIWSGTGVALDGTFDPNSIGQFELTYSVSGCVSTTLVNVAALSEDLPLTVWCQSLWADSLGALPFGGVWSGAGIVDADVGLFDPNEAGAGFHNLTYQIEGCTDTYTVEVLGIDAGGFSVTACPVNDPFIPYPGFSPTGGTWDGWGNTDPVSGMFDPGLLPDDTWSNLIYTAPNGCTDTLFMFVRTTEILLNPVYQCDTWNNMPLDWDFTNRTPWGGSWSGPGVVNPDGDNYEFSIDIAGEGVHELFYTLNGCTDSMNVIVHPIELPWDSLDVCEADAVFELVPTLPPGSWFTGDGISDSSGWFDPDLAGPGNHMLEWETPAGCVDQIEINVEDHLEASIEGLDTLYCWQNNAIALSIAPAAGVITGPVVDGTFNPALAGMGNHTITIDYVGTLCSSSATAVTQVLPALESNILISDTLICPGEGITLEAIYGGGGPDSEISFAWNQGLIALPTHSESPENSTTYVLTVTDGCSDPGVDSATVHILPPIEALISTSDTLCIGEEGWVTAEVATPGTYQLFWGDELVQLDTLFALAGNASELLITDLLEGCTFDTLTLVPNYTPISANFASNPNEDCIAYEANPIQFLDFSQFGLSGMWDFGNGETLNYDPDNTPEMHYETPGNYSVSLHIVNEGNCPDSAFLDLCILPPSALFIPDVFSPNGDFNNDVFYVRGKGITALYFAVYNRWGEQVFETNDPEMGWDGNWRGQPASTGNYSYVIQAVVNDWARIEQTGNILLVR